MHLRHRVGDPQPPAVTSYAVAVSSDTLATLTVDGAVATTSLPRPSRLTWVWGA